MKSVDLQAELRICGLKNNQKLEKNYVRYYE